MHFIENLLLALSLCVDTLSVTVAGSLSLGKVRASKVAMVALTFGVMQTAIMFIGWALGYSVVSYIEKISGWIGFILLLYIGGKMIWEAVTKKEEDRKVDLAGIRSLLIAGVATSIDASAVGLSMSMASVGVIEILETLAIVFVVTFLTALVGTLGGSVIGRKFGRPASIVGGIVLIGIGVWILLT